VNREGKVRQLEEVVRDCQGAYDRAVEFDREQGTRASAENLRETKAELKLAERWLAHFKAQPAAASATA
jgi:hypothetical protein